MKTEKPSFTCSQCNQVKQSDSDFTTGYGTNKEGQKICFACIGENDKRDLESAKPGQKFTLYLSNGEVINWPGTFRAPIRNLRTGKHNMARVRYYFNFQVGKVMFTGTQFGGNTQIAHCKAIK